MYWEYKVVKLFQVPSDTEHQLNVLGKERWELIAVSYNTAFLKREIASVG